MQKSGEEFRVVEGQRAHAGPNLAVTTSCELLVPSGTGNQGVCFQGALMKVAMYSESCPGACSAAVTVALQVWESVPLFSRGMIPSRNCSALWCCSCKRGCKPEAQAVMHLSVGIDARSLHLTVLAGGRNCEHHCLPLLYHRLYCPAGGCLAL
jgi:hypothetical protein